MKELTIEQMEHFLIKMKKIQEEHPKAKILYDAENVRINITYPLPRDIWITEK